MMRSSICATVWRLSGGVASPSSFLNRAGSRRFAPAPSQARTLQRLPPACAFATLQAHDP